MRGDHLIGELAEAGGHAVDGSTRLDGAFDDAATGSDQVAALERERDPAAVTHNGQELVERQRFPSRAGASRSCVESE